MGRFCGLIHRNPKLLCCLLEEAESPFFLPEGYPLAGWGLGYHQGSRVFLQKEPVVRPGAGVDFLAMCRGIESSDLICHVHRPPEGRWTYENAQPFGHQGWVAAHHGHVPGHDEIRAMRMAMLEEVAPFLRRNIQGCTDTELVFHLFLGELHHRRLLPGVRIDPADAARAMVEVVARLEAMVVRHAPPGSLADLHLTLLVSNGEVMVASALGIPLYWRQVDRIVICSRCSRPRTEPGRPSQEMGHAELAATWIISGLGMDGETVDERWQAVPDRSVIWATRAGKVEFLPLQPAPL
ncbi:MAG: hypothetical protein FJ125_11215 [Deltaproteobacteria bacterium]|nr:hypothetical protein [Deltaproteobacteria bacterium]